MLYEIYSILELFRPTDPGVQVGPAPKKWGSGSIIQLGGKITVGFQPQGMMATRVSMEVIVTIVSKLACFTYLGDVSNLLIKG